MVSCRVMFINLINYQKSKIEKPKSYPQSLHGIFYRLKILSKFIITKYK